VTKNFQMEGLAQPLGGIGAVSTIPNSFQMQFGARYSFSRIRSPFLI
jgi:hypothetical protein